MKEYKVILQGYDERGGRTASTEFDSEFDEKDFATVLWCVVEDIQEHTGKTLKEMFEALDGWF